MACRDRQRAEAAIQDIVQVKSTEQEGKHQVSPEDPGLPPDLLLLISHIPLFAPLPLSLPTGDWEPAGGLHDAGSGQFEVCALLC